MTLGTFLDLKGVAEHTGLEYATIRWYHNTATARRRDNTTKPGDMPPPDEVFGRSPVWKPTTIDKWMASRPGRGAGGGRPRKNPEGEQ